MSLREGRNLRVLALAPSMLPSYQNRRVSEGKCRGIRHHGALLRQLSRLRFKGLFDSPSLTRRVLIGPLAMAG